MKLYVGSSLTQAPKEFISHVEEIKTYLRKNYEVLEPQGVIAGTPEDVYRRDIEECVSHSDAFVALCDFPAIGLGYELAFAIEKLLKPTIALAHGDAKISRLVLGITKPHFRFARYETAEEAKTTIDIFLEDMSAPYPYLPNGRKFFYSPSDNPFMKEAKEYARVHSLDDTVKTASLVVKDNVVIGRGANGSDYHRLHGCERVRQHIPTGQGYELCEGCHPKNHSEPRALIDATTNGHNPRGADLYLWGHWWACESCWNAIIAAGIKNVFLLEGSARFFNKENPHNIIGKQFESP